MYLFQKIIMASEDVQSYVRSGRFYDGDETAETQDGAFVVMGDSVDHEIYKNAPDLNVRKIEVPTAVTDSPVVVDYVGVSEANVNGVMYRVGDSFDLLIAG